MHCFWRCPAWAHLRIADDIPHGAALAGLPPCTRNLGIVMEEDELVKMQDDFGNDADIPLKPCNPPGQQRVVIWTDGSTSHQADARFRRAGAGIFYGIGDDMNLALPLPGKVQTNQRAELFAVVKLLEREWRPVQIRSDSQYVVNGVKNFCAWQKLGWRGDNSDLWSQLAGLLTQRPLEDVEITKVKGHATHQDVECGAVLPEDKAGNDGADGLARAAASTQAAPADLLQRAAARRRQATAIQLMFLRILGERFAADVSNAAKGEAAENILADPEVATDP